MEYVIAWFGFGLVWWFFLLVRLRFVSRGDKPIRAHQLKSIEAMKGSPIAFFFIGLFMGPLLAPIAFAVYIQRSLIGDKE